ncbi:Gfo/Idh/MocA family oxidoreductase [Rhodococcus sp. NPDC057014]|uniref:Gfo/Idh/MocA family oxidoreductase n=1 Tax=Rhodococcus sp. NPDC057014 TaxID=3346000 RepID=UPI003633E439
MITDFDSSRAATIAEEVGARTVATAAELITAPDVDAVIIASHDSAHAEQVGCASITASRCCARSRWPRVSANAPTWSPGTTRRS